MSVTTAARPGTGWARVHLAALVIVMLSVALAASVSLLVVALVTGAESVPAGSGSVVQTVDNGCQQVRPGQPC